MCSTVTRQPRFLFDCFDVAFGEFYPKFEDVRSTDVEHVPGDIGFGVFPNDKAVRKGGEGPVGVVRQRDIGMLVVLDIEFGKDLAHAVDRGHRFGVAVSGIY